MERSREDMWNRKHLTRRAVRNGGEGRKARAWPPPCREPAVCSAGHVLVDTLMRPHGVVVGDIAGEKLPELPLTDNHKPNKSLTPDGSDKTLDMGIHVGRSDRSRYSRDAIGGVGEIAKEGIVVVDEMHGTIDGVAHLNELLTQELHSGKAGNGRVDDTPCLVGDDDEGIKSLSKDGVHGKEVHGEEGVDVGGKEATPREGGANLPPATEVDEDTTDGGLADLDIELPQFTLNLADAPHTIVILETEDQAVQCAYSPDSRPRTAC